MRLVVELSETRSRRIVFGVEEHHKRTRLQFLSELDAIWLSNLIQLDELLFTGNEGALSNNDYFVNQVLKIHLFIFLALRITLDELHSRLIDCGLEPRRPVQTWNFNSLDAVHLDVILIKTTLHINPLFWLSRLRENVNIGHVLAIHEQHVRISELDLDGCEF